MPDSDPRDETLAALLEVEALDELTRQRLVATALRASPRAFVPELPELPGDAKSTRRREWSRVSAGSRMLAAAAVLAVVAVGAITLLALPGSDGDDVPTALAPGAGTEHDARGFDPTSDQGGRLEVSPSARGSADGAGLSAPGNLADRVPVYVGSFGNLGTADEHDRLLLALELRTSVPAPQDQGSAATSVAPLDDLLAPLRCASDLPDGVRVAYATARFGTRDAVVVVSLRANGAQSIHVVVTDPCTVRRLDQ